VLLVDDDPVFLDVLARTFRRAHFDVHVERDGRAALEAATGARFQLVVTDYQMPGLDGVELAGALADALGDSAPPVVLVTGASPPPGPLEGVARQLRKPVPIRELLEVVDELLRASQATGTSRG
jgi:CheY-like chemotaxis protein